MEFIYLISDEYQNLLSELSKQWLLTEIGHRVSKEASNSYWRIANNFFHRLHVARGDRGRKVPQFSQIRNKMYNRNVPKVNLKIGYEAKDSGEITVVDVTSDPVSRFPRSSYKRLYEIASVDVSMIS